MKKKLLGFICLIVLLSGCHNEPAQVVQTTPPETETETQPTVSNLPLLEQGMILEESGNLRYIPNEELEQMTAPALHLLGNGLLLSEQGENTLALKHISLEDGRLLTKASVAAGPDTKLYIGNGEIGLCDRESGRITVLDEDFQIQRTYTIPLEGDEWYLNSELGLLYVFYSDQGLLVRDLDSGEEAWLVDNAFRLSGKGAGSGYVVFRYTDRADQKTCFRCLNLSTASLETLPVDSAVSGGIRQGDTWLLQSRDSEGCHFLVAGESGHSFLWTDSAVRLLAHRRHLLMTDPSGRNLTLYSSEGQFLSRCSLPQNSNSAVGNDFIWSGYWQGYFFTDFIDSHYRLMFWYVNDHGAGENLQLSPLDAVQEPQYVVDRALYERAAELSERFGVEIRIAEQCGLDYSHYDTFPLMDPVFIRSALDVLEDCLSQYPEGFFRQLPYDTVETIRIELVGGLTAKEDIDTHPVSVGAFVQNRGSCCCIVFDGFLIGRQTVFHEISHVIDRKLEWDSLIRENALFREETWLSLHPEGFRYAMTYTEIPEELLAFIENGYFINEYSLTFPTEDRAVLMAAAMENFSWDFSPGTGRRAKMEYYSACIRDCFDTTGWPEVTLWEQVLQ